MKTTDPANYPAAILANFDGDVAAAYEHLSKAYLAMTKQFFDAWSSRFIEISRFEADSDICVRQITKESISRSVGMADCEPDFVMRKWLYVDDAGELQPVTIGKQERFRNGIEQPFYFAASAIIAGNKQVGKVVYLYRAGNALKAQNDILPRMSLTPGRYTTRNNRVVLLESTTTREKQRSDGSTAQIIVWTGSLLKADGQTVDSMKEWEESNHPRVLANYISAGKAEGVPSEFDLISKLA